MVKTYKLPTPRSPTEFETFSNWIGEICDSMQGAAAQLARIAGVTPATVTYWRDGKVARAETVRKLAVALGVDENALLLLAAKSAAAAGRPRSTPDPLTEEMLTNFRRLPNDSVRLAAIDMLRALGGMSARSEAPATSVASTRTAARPKKSKGFRNAS